MKAMSIFAIQAPNESMINAGILPDDTLIFRKEKKAKENDIILCKVESTDEVLIRRYQIQAGRILLTNINIDSNLKVCMDIEIYGILTRVIRFYE